MTLDFSLPALVNSGGGLAFAGAGVLALRQARGDTRGRLVAFLAITFGVTYLVANIWPYETVPALVATLALQALVLLAAVLLIRHVVHPLTVSTRRSVAAVAIIVGAATVVTNAYGALRVHEIGQLATPGLSSEATVFVSIGVAAFFTTTGALAVLVCALAFAYRETPRERPSERRALALLACAHGLFVAFATSFIVPIHLPLNVGLLVTLVPLASWLLVIDGSLARNVTLALIAASAAGLVVSAIVWTYDLGWSTTYGMPGVLRTLGAFLLAIAVLQDGLAGAPTRPDARAPAPLALVALAALLVVAQVAQNFLSARSSLLVGGVISGLLVVAARPIERALEHSGPRRAKDTAARERSFRAAARRFYKVDGGLTREEERELMLLAEHLGIPIGRAYVIRDEVETEARS